jgi:hypothetical protein
MEDPPPVTPSTESVGPASRFDEASVQIPGKRGGGDKLAPRATGAIAPERAGPRRAGPRGETARRPHADTEGPHDGPRCRVARAGGSESWARSPARATAPGPRGKKVTPDAVRNEKLAVHARGARKSVHAPLQAGPRRGGFHDLSHQLLEPRDRLYCPSPAALPLASSQVPCWFVCDSSCALYPVTCLLASPLRLVGARRLLAVEHTQRTLDEGEHFILAGVDGDPTVETGDEARDLLHQHL